MGSNVDCGASITASFVCRDLARGFVVVAGLLAAPGAAEGVITFFCGKAIFIVLVLIPNVGQLGGHCHADAVSQQYGVYV